jgi:FkbM family methyltransferase
MSLVRKIVKMAVDYRRQKDVTPVKNLVYLGSPNHGYVIPADYLTSASVCYCVGAGTDISLDTELAARFRAQVFIFDPMPYALAHFNDLVSHAQQGKLFTADNTKDGYVYTVSAENLESVRYCATGIWNEQKVIKFYSPIKETYAGHSITNLQSTAKYIEAPVDKLANIMREFGHKQLDLLKLEIEGSEYVVIDDVLADKLDVKMILVEFDEFHHRRGLARLVAIRHIEQSSRKLIKAGYKLVNSMGFYKRAFIRADVFDSLVK